MAGSSFSCTANSQESDHHETLLKQLPCLKDFQPIQFKAEVSFDMRSPHKMVLYCYND